MGREELLNKLVLENIISDDDRVKILSWSKADDSQGIILGYVMGINPGVRPKDIARITGMSLEDALVIEKREEPPGSKMSGLKDLLPDVRGNLTDEQKAERAANVASSQAITQWREDILTAAYAALEQAHNAGDISTDVFNGLSSKLEKPVGYSKWDPTHEKLIFETIDTILGLEEIDADIRQELATEVDKREAEAEATRLREQPSRDGSYLPSGVRSEYEDQRGDWMAAIAEQASQDALFRDIPADTWWNALDQAGLITVDQFGEVTRSTPPTPIQGTDTFMDPATGRTYSQDDITNFKNDIVRATVAGVDADVAGAAARRVQDVADTPYWRDIDPVTGEDHGPGRAGRILEVSGRDARTGQTTPGTAFMPAEDLGIPTLLPDDPWEIGLYSYAVGDATFMWDQMSADARRSWTNDMTRYGMFSEDDLLAVDPTGASGMMQIPALQTAMQYSQVRQVGLRQAVQYAGEKLANNRARQSRVDAVARAFSIPASLREIPGPKTLAQEAKARFSQVLGREVLDDELAGLVPELKGYYEEGTQQKIALALAAWEGDNQGLLTGAQLQQIEDPGAATSFDIEDKWANEIDLNKRRESNADSFNRILTATMGGTPSLATMSPAAGVTQIRRT